MTNVKFNLFHVTNGTTKARVWYAVNTRADRRPCVTLYAKDYTRALGEILGDAYVNETDISADYFDRGRAILFADHPLYAAALDAARRYKTRR